MNTSSNGTDICMAVPTGWDAISQRARIIILLLMLMAYPLTRQHHIMS